MTMAPAREEILEQYFKFNQCHDEQGQFCSTGGMGGQVDWGSFDSGKITDDKELGHLNLWGTDRALKNGSVGRVQKASMALLEGNKPKTKRPEEADAASYLLNRVRTGETYPTLYRGMRIKPGEESSLRSEFKAGNTVRLPVSSFSPDQKVAEFWGGFKSGTTHLTPVIVEVRGAKGASLVTAPKQHEVVSAGSFRVSTINRQQFSVGRRFNFQTRAWDEVRTSGYRIILEPGGGAKSIGEKFNPHHDAHGRFASGGGGGITEVAPARAYTGKPIPVANKPSKLEVGDIGERIVAEHLQKQGLTDVRRLSVEEAQNFPVDLMADHQVIEVKTGLVSNGRSAQQWRATAGQPGPSEAAWLKKASPVEKAAWNTQKNKMAIERKQKVLEQKRQELGLPLQGKTYALILNPNTRRADLFVIDGFHQRIGWNTPTARQSYVATVAY